jgi:hypothetical protein
MHTLRMVAPITVSIILQYYSGTVCILCLTTSVGTRTMQAACIYIYIYVHALNKDQNIRIDLATVSPMAAAIICIKGEGNWYGLYVRNDFLADS